MENTDSTPRRSMARKILDHSTHKTPLKRHSPFKKPGNPPSALKEIENDDAQRLKRRSVADLQRRLSSVNSIGESPTVAESPLKGNQIKEHYDICLKLYAENKINPKNAWNLRFIECLKSMLQSRKITGKSSLLQVGGTSLDISAKLYSIRVDDVHSDGMKLASSMARIDDSKRNETDENEHGEGAPGNPRKPSGKKKRHSSENKHTVTTNVSTLLENIKKADYGEFQTRTNSEISAVDNFFTSKSTMDNSGTKFALMSKQQAWITYEDIDESIEDDKMYPFDLGTIGNIEICNEFASYEIDNWDPDKDDANVSFTNLNTSELVFDDKGIPIADLDGSVVDIFSEHHQADYNSSGEEEDFIGQQAMRGEVINISELKPIAEDMCMTNDYMYQSMSSLDNKCFMQIWAGPSHWKLKHLQRNVSRFSGAANKENIAKNAVRRKHKGTEFEPIDFGAPFDLNFKKGLMMITRKHDSSKVSLPQKFNIRVPPPLLIKNKATIEDVNAKKKTDEKAVQPEIAEDFECAPYDYENANDNDYCSQNVEEGTFQGEGTSANYEEEVNLIDVPNLVPDTKINYATQVKKMDMKLLKSKIWGVLTDGCETPGGVHSITFIDMYKKLPQVLNASMKEELSSPLAFVALLHLANEHNLKFVDTGNMNFIIEKDYSH